MKRSMRWLHAYVAWSVWLVAALALATPAQEAQRAAMARVFHETSSQRKAEALRWARARNMPVRFTSRGVVCELMRIEAGRPVYYCTDNANAAISTAADKVRQTPPYNVSGSTEVVGVWDAGAALVTHQEFGGRVVVGDGAAANFHGTHVAGTIGAAGVVTAAQGMAPAIAIESYDWNDDEAEMTARGASAPSQTNALLASNHSYGLVLGWQWGSWSGTTGWHWFNDLSVTTETWFGRYDDSSINWDAIACVNPYYLICKAAGNQRADNPANGDTIYYTPDNGITWLTATYTNTLHPPGDGVYKGGFDTMDSRAIAKNILAVGATYDAVSGGQRSLAGAVITSFSSFGPADDGRIKPDVVGNGYAVFSTCSASNTDYASFSGTSMAAPNVCGSAELLAEYYRTLHGGLAMRASTLKGLIIHTADDLGNPGPDYTYGWGLMNTKAAADLIAGDLTGTCCRIMEGVLSNGHARDVVLLPAASLLHRLKVTLCWTDPPGHATTNHDDRTPALVHDLDVRVITPAGVTNYPFVMDVERPAAPATTGDNTRDNVEQIVVDTSASSAGDYAIIISHKGTLTTPQWYSLVYSSDMFPDRFFVATHGADSNDGKTWATAWGSISNAVLTVPPNSTIYLGTGVFSMAEHYTDTNMWGPGGTALVIRTAGTKLVGQSISNTIIYCGPGYGGVRLEAHNAGLYNLHVVKEGSVNGSLQYVRGVVYCAWAYTNVVISNVYVRCLTNTLVSFGGGYNADEGNRFTCYNCLVEVAAPQDAVSLATKRGVFHHCTFVGGRSALYMWNAWGDGSAARFNNCVFASNNYLVYFSSNTFMQVSNSVYMALGTGVRWGSAFGTLITGRFERVDYGLAWRDGEPFVATGVFNKGWRPLTTAPEVVAPVAIPPGGITSLVAQTGVAVQVHKLRCCDLLVNGVNTGQWFTNACTVLVTPALSEQDATNTFVVCDESATSVATRIVVIVPEPHGAWVAGAVGFTIYKLQFTICRRRRVK